MFRSAFTLLDSDGQVSFNPIRHCEGESQHKTKKHEYILGDNRQLQIK